MHQRGRNRPHHAHRAHSARRCHHLPAPTQLLLTYSGICMHNLDPKSGVNCGFCYGYIFPGVGTSLAEELAPGVLHDLEESLFSREESSFSRGEIIIFKGKNRHFNIKTHLALLQLAVGTLKVVDLPAGQPRAGVPRRGAVAAAPSNLSYQKHPGDLSPKLRWRLQRAV